MAMNASTGLIRSILFTFQFPLNCYVAQVLSPSAPPGKSNAAYTNKTTTFAVIMKRPEDLLTSDN